MLYCGIDIAKGKSMVCIIDRNKNTLYHKEITHNKEGFEELQKHLTKDTIIGMESTGNYSKALYYYFKNKFHVYYIDNVQMHNYAKLSFLHVKNDKVDAKLIAEYLMTDFKKIIPGKMDELKDLCRLYHRAKHTLIKYRKSFQSQLCVIFPELEGITYIKKAKAVPKLLLRYSTPKAIVSATNQQIYDELISIFKEKKHFSIEYAGKLRQTAKESIGVSDYPVTCFRHTIRLMLTHQEILIDIKESLKHALGKTPYIKLLEKRGYGTTSLAAIAGEVGDIRRFKSYKKFVKYCGFDVSEKQSGTRSSKNCFITKQGNRYLRAMFYSLVLPQLTNEEEEFSAFYKRLKDKGKHSTKCMIAVARKIAVRTYFDMLRCHK